MKRKFEESSPDLADKIIDASRNVRQSRPLSIRFAGLFAGMPKIPNYVFAMAALTFVVAGVFGYVADDSIGAVGITESIFMGI